MKAVFVLLLLFLFSALLHSNAVTERFDPAQIALRNTSAGTLQLIGMLEERLKTDPDSYDLHWKLALACYYYGDFYARGVEARKSWFARCRYQAQLAVDRNPDGVDGIYWLGVGYAMWANENGIVESLINVNKIIQSMNRVIDLDPAYFDGLPWAIRAKVYAALPGLGNREKAETDMENALRYGKNYRAVYQVASDLYISLGDYGKAEALVQAGLSLPFDRTAEAEEKVSLRDLSNDLQILKEKAK
jgi:tetratricopeptide (TPR) repeat protein